MGALLLFTTLISGAYARTRASEDPSDSKAHCSWWKAGQITFVQNQQGDPHSPGDTELAAVSASFASWQAVSDACGNFNIVETAQTTRRDLGFDPLSSSNQNLILFRDKLCDEKAPPSDPCWGSDSCGSKYDCWQHSGGTIALTITSFDRRTGQILDGDMEMNAASFIFTTADSQPCAGGNQNYSCISTDVQNTVTHEAGHFLGLAHVADFSSTMYRDAKLGEISKRSLDADSQAFVCDVYPKGLPSQDCIVPAVSDDIGSKSGCQAVSGLELGGLWAAMALWGLWGRAGRRSRFRRGRGE